jgi:hypothetical protein
MATTWTDRTGISEPQIAPTPDTPAFLDTHEWAQRVQVDLPVLREYARAVFAATDNYLACLSDDDLNRPVDLSAIGFGQKTVAWVLTMNVANANQHCGEISCLKGIHETRGYPD